MPKTKSILTLKIKPFYLLLGALFALIFIYLFVDFDNFYSGDSYYKKSSQPVQTDLREKEKPQHKEDYKEEPYVYAGRWKEEFRFSWPAKMIRSSSGYLYLLERNRHRIWRFTMSGTDILDFKIIHHEELDLPNYFAVDNNSNLYANSGRYGKILKFNSEGIFVKMWDSYKSVEAYGGVRYISISGLAVDSKGNVYAIDKKENLVLKFDSDGNFIKKWGLFGDTKTKLSNGIVIDGTDNIYICGNSKVQKFDSEGNFILEFGGHGNKDGEFKGIADIAIGPDRNLYIADRGNHRIQIFSSNGKWLEKFGKWGKGELKEGEIKEPISIMVDNDGKAYVISSADVNYKIQVFIPSKEKIR